MLQKLTNFVRETVTRQLHQPLEEMGRLQRVLLYCYDLTRFCAEQLTQDRATQMAAALTYRTIFSLVPTIILALIVFRAFVSFDEAQQFMEDKVYSALALDSIAIQNSAEANTDAVQLHVEEQKGPIEELLDGDSAKEPPQASEEDVAKTEQAVRQTFKDILSGFVEKGYSINVASIGGAGLLLLAWAALALVVTVENCFNRVFQCRTGRPWHMRIMLYWAVLTLGPVLLMMSLYMTNRIYGAASSIPIIGALFQALGSFAALGASWLLLFLVYMLMPNTKVHVRPALIGAFVAALLWEIGKVGFKIYVTKAVTYSVLYGSLGLLPLFLFWMYLTWMIVLFGLELTYVLQTMKGRKLAQQQRKLEDRDLIADSRYLLPIMTTIGDAFEHGRAVDDDDVARQLQLPQQVAANFCRKLEDAGMIHRLDDGTFALARPANRIAIADLLKLARSLAHLHDRPDAAPGWALLAQLNAAETEASAGRTLADVLHRDPPPA